MRSAKILSLLVLLGASALAQQSKSPVTNTVREMLPRQEKNLVAAAEEMPAEKYGYRPTPQQMSFAHLVLHISESNTFLCSKLSDTAAPKSAPLKETDTRENLIAGLKASFAFCSDILAKVDDSKLGDTVELFGGHSGPKAFALIALTNNWADHYGAAAMYLRLNGLLPPTAQPKK